MWFFGKIGINPHFYSEAINKHIEEQVDTQHLYKEEKQHGSTRTLLYSSFVTSRGQGSSRTRAVDVFYFF